MPAWNVSTQVGPRLKNRENRTQSFGFEAAKACNLACNSCLDPGGNKASTIACPLAINPRVTLLKVVASAMFEADSKGNFKENVQRKEISKQKGESEATKYGLGPSAGQFHEGLFLRALRKQDVICTNMSYYPFHLVGHLANLSGVRRGLLYSTQLRLEGHPQLFS